MTPPLIPPFLPLPPLAAHCPIDYFGRLMRILDRYILRELLIPFGYCLGGFWIFWTAFDLFTNLSEFQSDNLRMSDVVEYYGLKTPEMMVMVLPIAFLLALLYALTDMARHQELTAMRAAGVGLWRIALPYFCIGLVLSGIVFVVNEVWVPQTVEAAQEAKHRRKKDVPPELKEWKALFGFVNVRQKRTWFMEAYNVKTSEMIAPNVKWRLATGTRWEILAERARYIDGAWIFSNAQEYVFPTIPGELPTRTTTNFYRASFSENPEQILSEIKISNINSQKRGDKTYLRDVNKTHLSIREILDYKDLHGDDSSEVTMFGGSDITHLAAFVNKLNKPTNGISVYLREQLSPPTLEGLASYQGTNADARLQAALAEELNRVIRGPSLYDAHRFAGVTLSDPTRRQLRQQPQGEQLVRLNRLLLEDAYQQEIARDNASLNNMLDTKLHGRLATPWTCLVVVLIALPFGAVTGRRNVFVGVASSIVICFAYFVVLQLALALGTGGKVPPFVAGWGPNIIFGLTGIMLTYRVR